MRAGPNRRSSFTLIELLVSVTILAALVLLLSSLVIGVNRAWVAGEQQTSEFQDGRAILEIIGRELSPAAISPNLQFVQNPSLPTAIPRRANSDSIFWLAPSATTASGNLAEIGYYLAQDATNNSGAEVYQLRRFYVPPTDATNYQIFTAPNTPQDGAAPWVTNFVSTTLSTPIATGVLAFWVRCFDVNGNPIPWPVSDGTGLKFNSAAHFQPAIPGQTALIQYTNPTSTVQANLLPVTVELTIVTLDAQSFKRGPSIPAQNAQAAPDDLSTTTAAFNQALINNNIKNARTFSTRVTLINAR